MHVKYDKWKNIDYKLSNYLIKIKDYISTEGKEFYKLTKNGEFYDCTIFGDFEISVSVSLKHLWLCESNYLNNISYH